jgi:hypothetical protein
MINSWDEWIQLGRRFTNNGFLPPAENSALILRMKSGDYPLLCEECEVSSPH